MYGRLRNKLSQLILIILDRSFRMKSISFFFERCLRGERSLTYPYLLSAWARKHLVPFITYLVWRGRGSKPRHPAHGANALTTEPLPSYYITILSGPIYREMPLRLYGAQPPQSAQAAHPGRLYGDLKDPTALVQHHQCVCFCHCDKKKRNCKFW